MAPTPEALSKFKTYAGRRFTTDTIREATGEFRKRFDAYWHGVYPLYVSYPNYAFTRSVSRGEETWTFSSDDEFFADLRRRGITSAQYSVRTLVSSDLQVSVNLYGTSSRVHVGGFSRDDIEAVFEVFERGLSTATELSLPPKNTVLFIGHGHSSDWRDLKDYLQDKMGYTVEAYETGARSGHDIRTILEQMLDKSTFALLVATAEDETATGALRMRQNVVHEMGLFQGRLGFSRAIAVVEEDVELFTNLDGVQQIRFATGRIKETFGEVVATLKREFPTT